MGLIISHMAHPTASMLSNLLGFSKHSHAIVRYLNAAV